MAIVQISHQRRDPTGSLLESCTQYSRACGVVTRRRRVPSEPPATPLAPRHEQRRSATGITAASNPNSLTTLGPSIAAVPSAEEGGDLGATRCQRQSPLPLQVGMRPFGASERGDGSK